MIFYIIENRKKSNELGTRHTWLRSILLRVRNISLNVKSSYDRQTTNVILCFAFIANSQSEFLNSVRFQITCTSNKSVCFPT